ncbi:metallothionein-2 [Drosophila serrata]|uniref:metallothionein-2 n=1 Tax=Drosophila serrata TaxID=7274 RepID=UPI000A1D3132|nr:metallothionein-2 [Drosophila serrata]
MPCESCGKDCKCSPQKCSEGCKCPSPDKCDCNVKKKAASSGAKERVDAQGGKCCGGNK